MKKRGISPLIATVLMIAFTIILFALITTWVRRSAVQPAMESEGKIASTLECSEIDIKIISACINNSNRYIKIAIDNQGNKDLYGINLRVIGNIGLNNTKITELNLEPLGRYKSDEIEISGTGDINKVEIYPIISTGTCEGQPTSTTNLENVQDEDLSKCN